MPHNLRNNTSIHVITPQITKNVPCFKETWKVIDPFLENQIVVAQNTRFDMNGYNRIHYIL